MTDNVSPSPPGADFCVALRLVQEGLKVARIGWNGKGMSVEAQFPDAHSKMSSPYLYLNNAQGHRFPWFPSAGDLFANDWYLVSPSNG